MLMPRTCSLSIGTGVDGQGLRLAAALQKRRRRFAMQKRRINI
jgi:hypothetical protein